MHRVVLVGLACGSEAVSNVALNSGPLQHSANSLGFPLANKTQPYRETVGVTVGSNGQMNASMLSSLSQRSVVEGGFKVSCIPSQLRMYSKWFDKFIPVFGFPVLAVPEVPDWMVKHSASIFAQFLDWDADGKVNNEKIYQAMLRKRATLALFYHDAPDSFFVQSEKDRTYVITLQSGSIPSWTKDPVNPDTDIVPHTVYVMRVPAESVALMRRRTSFSQVSSLARRDEQFFDAAVEEIMHLIFDVGYAVAYPRVFAPDQDSLIAQCMVETIADCGFAFNKTFKYPNCNGHWHYDEPTCEFGCLVSEYIFRSLTTLLDGFDGSHNDVRKGACKDMQSEWPMCTAALLKKYEPRVVDLYDLHGKNPFGVPTVLPDGQYRPKIWPKMTLDPRYKSRGGPQVSSQAVSAHLKLYHIIVWSVVAILFVYIVVHLKSKNSCGSVRAG